ncbi:MAG: Ig-like domain-containing protein [Prolixibacteraceae bacterium]|jgi:hypothetical protein|nr:Ig-like domain-containing protein [Prolixibacteraceae bacterium]
MNKLLAITLLFIGINSATAQKISPYLIGNNAWQPTWHNGAKLGVLWDELNDAGFQLIRIGGNGAQNSSDYTNERIGELVKDIHAIGAVPIVQVPHTFNTNQTTTLIAYLNDSLNLNVKFWGIGNEPNLDNDWSDPIAISQVATYIKTIASALKAYDPTVKIQGPDCAWFDSNYHNPLFVNSGTNNISGKDENGNYYIDFLAWHKYGLTKASDIEGNVNAALSIIEGINADRPEEFKMTWAIGEINSHYNNGMVGETQKVWSFESGQMFAELYDLGMRKGAFTICPWSIFESNGARIDGDLGLFDLVNGELKGRSSYYHTLMLGQNMKTNYLSNTDNKSTVSVTAMGDETGTAIMIMNRSSSTDYEYALCLDSTLSSDKELLVNVYAKIEKTIEGKIPANTTIMQVFDTLGVLQKRFTYNKEDALAMCAPTIETFTGNAGNSGSINFSSPTKNQRFEEKESFNVEVIVSSESEIVEVELIINDSLIAIDSVAPYIWKMDSSLILLPLGSYELKTIARTINNDELSTNLKFTIQEPIVLPTVEFTSPLDGDIFEEGIDLQVTNLKAEHETGIANVQLYLNDKLVRQENLPSYDWGLSGQNDALLQNMSPGIYELKAIAKSNSGISNQTAITINIEEKVGITIFEQKNIHIYPNPASRNISIHGVQNGVAHFYNLDGRLIKSIDVSNTINIEDLNKGIYILEIEAEDNNSRLKFYKY